MYFIGSISTGYEKPNNTEEIFSEDFSGYSIEQFRRRFNIKWKVLWINSKVQEGPF